MKNRNLRNFSVDRDNAGVFRLTLDVPGRAVNVLDRGVMTELEQIVAELENRDDVTLVVIESGKESGFLAGADVDAISSISCVEEAERVLEQGQRLFSRIECLPMPTLAVVHGPCLGGGLELALACDYRIARDNSSTKIGLPEIKLGLIPGWGGTQRLPKRIGLMSSMEMILTGRHLSAGEALKIGLIDRAVPPERWPEEVARVIDQLAAGKSIRRPRFGIGALLQCVLSSAPARPFLLKLAKKKTAAKSHHYPALDAAWNAIADGYRSGVDGYATERREFGKLIFSPTCRQLLHLFESRERARSVKTWAARTDQWVHGDPIRKLGVVGAGAMGAGIAQVAATRGYEVSIKEADREAALAGANRIDRLVTQYGHRKGWDEARTAQLRGRIDIAADFDSFEGVDCVVEAIVERMEIKQSVLAAAEAAVGPSTILATNTSALSVTEMSKSLLHPNRFAGLHFFNPVHRMELVEVVRGRNTDDATIARLVAFVRALGKTPIVTSDSPGFLVNRILFPYLGEAVLMVREGHKIATIDREIRAFGMPMGPLELLDRVGLDVALHVAQSLGGLLCDADQVAEVLAVLVERQETGVKSEIGFYDYRNKPKTARGNSDLVATIDVPATSVQWVDDGLSEIQRRLLYPMLAEAIRCSDEAVVEYPWAIDLAMVLGTGFAPHRGGPLRLVDQIGAITVHSNLDKLRSQFGDRFAPPTKLLTRS
jgi:3-hydroxyacyl-CoA dehydrogenase/enoyl-CoA hydratase/3-hydroxybutyryl-CoA epimerase